MDVSILIPCYNAAPYLAATIRSAISQLPTDRCEILVWDDGSTDGSDQVASGFGDRIVRLGDGINRGGNEARYWLTEAARGTWLQFLDADDVLLSGKIAGQLNAASGDTNADVVYSPPIALPADHPAWAAIDSGDDPDRWNVAADVLKTEPTDPWIDFIRWGDFQTTSMLFRRSRVIEAGNWKRTQPRCQEHELILRMMVNHAELVRTSERRTLYRVHAGQSVSRKDLAATVRTRMELTQSAETHLTQTGQMTRLRRSALQAVKLEAARNLHAKHPVEAREWFRRAGRCGVLSAAASDALPRSYRYLAASLGLDAAEAIAAIRRGPGSQS